MATQLEGLGYTVITNRAYTDFQEGKSRELEVWAHKHLFQLEERRLWAAIHLLIECKNTAAHGTGPKNGGNAGPSTPAPHRPTPWPSNATAT